MAVTLINLSGFQRGVSSDETGINVESFVVTVEPEFKDKLPGKSGEILGFAVSALMRTLKIAGEISGGTGVMAITATTAFSAANGTTYFGASAGGFYFDRGEVTQDRTGWKRVDVELSANAGVS